MTFEQLPAEPSSIIDDPFAARARKWEKPICLAMFNVSRTLPILASAAIHVAVIASAVAGDHSKYAAPLAEPLLQLELELEPLHEPARLPSGPSETSVTTLGHQHPYPVSVTHDAVAHDPALVHAPLPPGVPSSDTPTEVNDSAPTAPRFTMVLGNPSTSRVAASGGTGIGISDTGAAEPILNESGVSSAARLLSVAPATYPQHARNEQVEADVPVEIVVDTAGSVTEAKVIQRAGYGLDAAALEAVRKYRFSPAQRAGRAVRVRMRWVVQFRLN